MNKVRAGLGFGLRSRFGWRFEFGPRAQVRLAAAVPVLVPVLSVAALPGCGASVWNYSADQSADSTVTLTLTLTLTLALLDPAQHLMMP